MFLRVGVCALALLLASAVPVASEEASLYCVHVVAGKPHSSPVLKVDAWITDVKYGPGGLKVGDHKIPPGGIPKPPHIPSPYVLDAPEDTDTSYLKKIADDLVPYVVERLNLTKDELPVVQIEVQTPRPDPHHPVKGQRITFIVNLPDCVQGP